MVCYTLHRQCLISLISDIRQPAILGHAGLGVKIQYQFERTCPMSDMTAMTESLAQSLTESVVQAMTKLVSHSFNRICGTISHRVHDTVFDRSQIPSAVRKARVLSKML
jgi:hypothetical protein